MNGILHLFFPRRTNEDTHANELYEHEFKLLFWNNSFNFFFKNLPFNYLLCVV
jgi:hypothetical protein